MDCTWNQRRNEVERPRAIDAKFAVQPLNIRLPYGGLQQSELVWIAHRHPHVLVGEFCGFLHRPELARKFNVFRGLGDLPVQVTAETLFHLLFERLEHAVHLVFLVIAAHRGCFWRSILARAAACVVQIPTIGAAALQGSFRRTGHVMALATEKRSVGTTAQFHHGSEVLALDAIGASQRRNYLFPRARALRIFHAGCPARKQAGNIANGCQAKMKIAHDKFNALERCDILR
jgi:hypothetical protein